MRYDWPQVAKKYLRDRASDTPFNESKHRRRISVNGKGHSRLGRLNLNAEIDDDHLTLGPEKSPPVSILRISGYQYSKKHRLLSPINIKTVVLIGLESITWITNLVSVCPHSAESREATKSESPSQRTRSRVYLYDFSLVSLSCTPFSRSICTIAYKMLGTSHIASD